MLSVSPYFWVCRVCRLLGKYFAEIQKCTNIVKTHANANAKIELCISLASVKYEMTWPLDSLIWTKLIHFMYNAHVWTARRQEQVGFCTLFMPKSCTSSIRVRPGTKLPFWSRPFIVRYIFATVQCIKVFECKSMLRIWTIRFKSNKCFEVYVTECILYIILGHILSRYAIGMCIFWAFWAASYLRRIVPTIHIILFFPLPKKHTCTLSGLIIIQLFV